MKLAEWLVCLFYPNKSFIPNMKQLKLLMAKFRKNSSIFFDSYYFPKYICNQSVQTWQTEGGVRLCVRFDV